jgi:multidrug efflux pump subunit AcrA (membrane-fusion protein)
MTSAKLDRLAALIRAEHDAVLATYRKGIEHAFAAGDLLIEAHDLVPYGDWGRWLAENCATLSERTAYRYVRLARHRSELEEFCHSGGTDPDDLTLAAAERLLAPEPDPAPPEDLTDTQRDQILALQQNFKWSAAMIADRLRLPLDKVAAFLNGTKTPPPAPEDPKPEDPKPEDPQPEDPDEVALALAAEREQHDREVTARRDAFYAAAADFINQYRLAHLDLEFADIDAVFDRIQTEARAARRGKVLTLPLLQEAA